MIITETEARSKQCRVLATTNDAGKPAPTACAGSACAHWRWSAARETKAFIEAAVEHMKETGCGAGKALDSVYADHKDEFKSTEGYCGLAGVPK